MWLRRWAVVSDRSALRKGYRKQSRKSVLECINHQCLQGFGGLADISLSALCMAQIDTGKQCPEFGRSDLMTLLGSDNTGAAERHRVRTFLQTLCPDREAVAIPVEDLDPVAPPVGEDEQMSAESVQLHRLSHQSVQAVKALAHVAGRSAEIDAHAGRQVHHQRSRSTFNTVRRVVASAPGAMRRRSPEARISSSGANRSAPDGCASTSANRTGSTAASRFRQL